MNASDIMTPNPCVCSPNDTLQEVAQAMRDHDCGAMPVVDNGCIVGIVTDRDLAIRALAEGKSPTTKVGAVFTPGPSCCKADDDVSDVEKIMVDRQVRRVPVVNADGRCVGIVSQADLARAASQGRRVSEHEIAIVVEQISKPQRSSSDGGVELRAEQRL